MLHFAGYERFWEKWIWNKPRLPGMGPAVEEISAAGSLPRQIRFDLKVYFCPFTGPAVCFQRWGRFSRTSGMLAAHAE
jgi:hypothetical protein